VNARTPLVISGIRNYTNIARSVNVRPDDGALKSKSLKVHAWHRS
jgi:hypothetical protein